MVDFLITYPICGEPKKIENSIKHTNLEACQGNMAPPIRILEGFPNERHRRTD